MIICQYRKSTEKVTDTINGVPTIKQVDTNTHIYLFVCKYKKRVSADAHK